MVIKSGSCFFKKLGLKSKDHMEIYVRGHLIKYSILSPLRLVSIIQSIQISINENLKIFGYFWNRLVKIIIRCVLDLMLILSCKGLCLIIHILFWIVLRFLLMAKNTN